MPIRYVLANLLAANEDAVAVALLDEEGESVEVVSAEYQPYEVRVVGAYLAISMRRAQDLAAAGGLGVANQLQIDHGELAVHVRPVEDGYFLALLERRPSLTGKTRASLGDAADQLRRDLFEQPRDAGE